MDLNRGNLQVLFQTLSSEFQKGFLNSPDLKVLEILTTTTGAMTAAELYGFLLRTVAWKVWKKGMDRQFQNVTADQWRVEVETFEASVRIPFQDILDDHVQLYSPLTQQMAFNWINTKIRRIINMLVDNCTCPIRTAAGVYTNLFADTHPYGSYNVDNSNTLALDRANYVATRQVMQSWLYANGDPIGTYPSVILCGPKLQDTAQQLFQAQMVYNGSGTALSNVLMGDNVTIIVRPELNATAGAALDVDAADYWYLLDCRQPLKPFVYIDRQEASIIGPSDPELVLRTGFADYLGTARGEFSPTFPHLCYRQAAT
jgi:phage major head subunit gpT-like protein